LTARVDAARRAAAVASRAGPMEISAIPRPRRRGQEGLITRQSGRAADDSGPSFGGALDVETDGSGRVFCANLNGGRGHAGDRDPETRGNSGR
jgi:hypothetical protein